MAIKVKSNLNLDVKLKQILDNTAQILQQELITAATEIGYRTSQGKQIGGQTFKKYSPSYAKKKAKEGRQVSPPNLTQTGKMLSSARKVTIEKTNTGFTGRIGFTSPDEAQKGAWNQEKRPWFGLQEKQKTQIIRRLRGK